MDEQQAGRVEVGFAGSWYALSMRALHDHVLNNLVPSEWVSRAAKRWLKMMQPENAVEIYILVVTGILAWFWLSLPTSNDALRVAALVVCAVRWFEVFVVALGLIAGSAYVVAGKSIFTAGLYAVQMVLIFATIGEATVASATNWLRSSLGLTTYGHQMPW